MKNLKLRFVSLTLFLAVTTIMTTSCGSGTDVSDKDEVGTFELTIDGKKETGTKVFNGAAIGIRTISAENSNIDLGILFNEDDFKSGATLDASKAALSSLTTSDMTYIITSGSIKVISTSKIQLNDCVFIGYGKVEENSVTVSGFISSK